MTDAAAGWYSQGDGSMRYWDGSRWTEHASRPRPTTIGDEQVAHDLALVYLTNRYGADVTGHLAVTSYDESFDVAGASFGVLGSTTIRTVTSVSGGGEVTTRRLPGVEERKTVRVGTGERRFLFGPEKSELREMADFKVDDVFISMIADYRAAYERFLILLRNR